MKRYRWVSLAGGLVLVAVAGVVGFVVVQGGGSAGVVSAADFVVDVRFGAASDASGGAMSPSKPVELELPEVDPGEAVAVAEELSGGSAALVEFLVAVEGLWDETPFDDVACEGARKRFETIASPPDLVSLARQLDDPPASDVFASLVAVTALVMSDCGVDEANVAEMAWHWAVGYRRLAELGVAVP